MAYKTYFFRASSRQALLDGVSQTFSDEGVDPSRIMVKDEDGSLHVNPAIGVFLKAGEWWKTEPEYGNDGSVMTEGVRGDHAIGNVRTNDPYLQDVFESVAVGETRNSVKRVDPSTPVREFAK